MSSSDEMVICEMVVIWMVVFRLGDVDIVLDLVLDDVVFLMLGWLFMCKDEFMFILWV